MIELPEAVVMAAPTQDYVTGNAAASDSDVSESGAVTSESAIIEEAEALKREMSILSQLNKSTSYVDTVLDTGVCNPVPEPEPVVEQTGVPAMRRESTMDADEILSLLPVTKTFCARYFDQLAKKTPSKGPKTPAGSPWGSIVSRKSSGVEAAEKRSVSGMMTPPVGSICPLVAGPLITAQLVDSMKAPSLVNNLSVSSDDVIPDIEENQENGDGEVAMETDDTGNGEATESTSGAFRMDSAVTTPPPPMLSPVRSVPGASPETPTAAAPGPATGVPAGFVPAYPGAPAPVQIAFSFDTTGSMSQCIDEVRAQLRDIIQRLLGDVPHLQIAVIAHGDYCDVNEFYMIKSVDFTNDVNALTQFVNDVSGTGGGDYDECYEYVLNYARNKLTWSPWTQRSLVMIGDATPHAPDYHLNTLNLEWGHEANLLFLNGVHIYAVQCQKSTNEPATPFWRGLAEKTEGKHITMEDFSSVVDLMLAICYKETGPEFFDAYEREVRFREARAGLNKDLAGMFATLRSDSTASSSSGAALDLTTTGAPAASAALPAPTARGVRGGARKVGPKKLAGARKKPNTAAKKTAAAKMVKTKLVKGCSCVICDDKPSGSSGCTCVMCWTPDAATPSTSSLGRTCSCVMCDGTKTCACIMCASPPSTTRAGRAYKPYRLRKDCSCMMCGGATKPKRVITKATKKNPVKNTGAAVTSKKEKKPRESVPEGRFSFRDFKWSPWKVAMVPTVSGVLKNWEPCARTSGLMRTDLFKDVLSKPAVYEVAVQPARGCKKYVVYCKASKGLKMKRTWERHILPNHVYTIIDNALQNDCKIFVRSAPIAPQRKTVKIGAKSFKFTSPLQVKNFMVKTYDYAWQKRRVDGGGVGTRLLTKAGVALSGCSN